MSEDKNNRFPFWTSAFSALKGKVSRIELFSPAFFAALVFNYSNLLWIASVKCCKDLLL